MEVTLRQGSVRAGYKKTEVGLIPDSWNVSALGGCAEVIMGQSPVGTSYNSKGNGAPLINGPTEFTNKYPIKIQWTTQPTKYCKVADLLLCVRGSSTGRINIADDEYCIGRGVAAIRAKLENDNQYMIFQVDNAVKGILSLTTGSTFPNIDGKTIRSIKIPLPPTLAEQTAIAIALSDTDSLIQSLEKLIAKKRAIKQGAMHDLLTGKKRLQGFEKKKGLQKTEIGEIPADWQLKPFSALFNISGGYTASRDQLSDTGYCYLHYGDIHTSSKLFVDVKSEFSNIPKLDVAFGRVSSKSLLSDGDVVFVDASEDDEGTSKHIVVRNKENIPYISGLHTIVVKSKTDEIDNLFKEFCFQTKVIKRQFYYYAVGTKVSGISKANIAKVFLPFPEKKEQAAMAQILSDMDSELSAHETKLAKYRAIKQGMMQELLTGKTRLV